MRCILNILLPAMMMGMFYGCLVNLFHRRGYFFFSNPSQRDHGRIRGIMATPHHSRLAGLSADGHPVSEVMDGPHRDCPCHVCATQRTQGITHG